MVLKTSAYDSLSYAVIIELYFWIKISEGYTTLQNNVTKKDPLEYKGMYTGGKAAGFEQKKDGNKAPNSSRQPREVSGNEGTVAREGTGLAAWMWERTQILPPVEPSSSCPSSSAVQRDFNQKRARVLESIGLTRWLVEKEGKRYFFNISWAQAWPLLEEALE